MMPTSSCHPRLPSISKLHGEAHEHRDHREKGSSYSACGDGATFPNVLLELRATAGSIPSFSEVVDPDVKQRLLVSIKLSLRPSASTFRVNVILLLISCFLISA